MRRLVLAPILALAAACSSPCQDLATRICECQPAGSARDACQNAVEQQIDGGNPRPGEAQQDFCEQKLDTCADPSNDRGMCDRLLTEQGRVDCGLAFPEDPAQ